MAPSLFQWEGLDKFFSPRETSTPISQTPPPSGDHVLPPPLSDDCPLPTPPTSSSMSSEDEDYPFVPCTPPDSQVPLDDVWENVRKAKERIMFSSPSKIKSLENYSPSAHPSHGDPTPNDKGTRLKKGKSYVKFKESADGLTVTAIFDLPRVDKDNMHVSFQGTRLAVSWRTVNITEREEPLENDIGGTRILRELEHKKYSRTIPLPEGARFEEIRAARDGRYLVVTYPNVQTVRPGPPPLPIDGP